MNDLLKALYDTFYKPPKMTETLSEIKSIHQQLVEQLDKPARRLVLKLVDDEEKIADDLSLDSFIAGFQLAWQLSAEVNYRCESNTMVMKDYGQDEICPDEE